MGWSIPWNWEVQADRTSVLRGTILVILILIKQIVLYFKGEVLKQLEEGHYRRIQELVADSSDGLGKTANQLGISLHSSFYPGFIEHI